MVGLSSFNTTLFRITDNGEKTEPSIEIFLDELKSHVASIRSYYLELRELFQVPLSDKVPNQLNISNVVIKLTHYDRNQIPLEMDFSERESLVHVEVKGYEVH